LLYRENDEVDIQKLLGFTPQQTMITLSASPNTIKRSSVQARATRSNLALDTKATMYWSMKKNGVYLFSKRHI